MSDDTHLYCDLCYVALYMHLYVQNSIKVMLKFYPSKVICRAEYRLKNTFEGLLKTLHFRKWMPFSKRSAQNVEDVIRVLSELDGSGILVKCYASDMERLVRISSERVNLTSLVWGLNSYIKDVHSSV